MKLQSENDKRRRAKKKNLVLLTEPEDFDREVSQEESPVLVSFLAEDPNHASQLKVLEDAMEIFGGSLKFCLVDELFAETFAGRYRVSGAPTFIVFSKGDEKGRKLGRVDEETLTKFLTDFLPETGTARRSKQEDGL